MTIAPLGMAAPPGRQRLPTPPTFDFSGGAIRMQAVLWLAPYTEPYPNGRRVAGPRIMPETQFEIIAAENCEEYVCALITDGSWVNVWALHNLRGEAHGVTFARRVRPGARR